MGEAPDAASEELLWTVAVARLILGPDMNIQVPPNLNSDNYEIYLNAGINDWGGVSPVTIDYVNPEAPWPGLAELRNRTEAMGFSLKPRLPVYPEFFDKAAGYLTQSMRIKMSDVTDDQGYVLGGIERYAGTS